MVQAGASAASEFGLCRPAAETDTTMRRQYVQRTYRSKFATATTSRNAAWPVIEEAGKQRTRRQLLRIVRILEKKTRRIRRAYGGEGEYDDRRSDTVTYREVPPPDIYGLSSGRRRVRLFPNPTSRPSRGKVGRPNVTTYDADYYSDPELVRPYRVGMSCAFCHASFHRCCAARHNESKMGKTSRATLAGAIPAHSRRFSATCWTIELHLSPPGQPTAGTVDTSLHPPRTTSTNPNAMNAVFKVPQRVLPLSATRKRCCPARASRSPRYGGVPRPVPPPGAEDTVPQKYLSCLGAWAG